MCFNKTQTRFPHATLKPCLTLQELLLCQGIPMTSDAARACGYENGELPISFENVAILD